MKTFKKIFVMISFSILTVSCSIGEDADDIQIEIDNIENGTGSTGEKVKASDPDRN
ncbi:MAG: hypothetical protein AAF363_15460 [Bacteroidota bacterium]